MDDVRDVATINNELFVVLDGSNEVLVFDILITVECRRMTIIRFALALSCF